MRRLIHAAAAGALLIAVSSQPARGQQVTAGTTDFHHATTLGVVGGIAVDQSGNGGALGGSVGWQLTPGASLAGSAIWMHPGPGTNGFAMLLNVGMNTRTGWLQPGIYAGGGVYRVTFDMLTASPPSFYGKRLQGSALPASTTFNDPAVTLGANLRISLTRHTSIQPAVEALVVLDGGDAYVLTTATVSLVYRFEHHPVTPVVRGR